MYKLNTYICTYVVLKDKKDESDDLHWLDQT